MQHAIPYITSLPTTTNSTTTASERDVSDVQNLVRENAVIVFGRRGCCMCHVVRLLLLGLGVNPTIFEVDEEHEATVIDELSKIIGCEGEGDGGGESGDIRQLQFPAVFVGGKLFGGLERVMATHISGDLVPILKDAGALWL